MIHRFVGPFFYVQSVSLTSSATNVIYSVDDVCEAELHGRSAPHLSAASGFLPDQNPP